jgi:hypothetical protein
MKEVVLESVTGDENDSSLSGEMPMYIPDGFLG